MTGGRSVSGPAKAVAFFYRAGLLGAVFSIGRFLRTTTSPPIAWRDKIAGAFSARRESRSVLRAYNPLPCVLLGGVRSSSVSASQGEMPHAARTPSLKKMTTAPKRVCIQTAQADMPASSSPSPAIFRQPQPSRRQQKTATLELLAPDRNTVYLTLNLSCLGIFGRSLQRGDLKPPPTAWSRWRCIARRSP